MFIILFCKAWFQSGSIVFFCVPMKLGGDQKEKRRTYGTQCQDQEAKTATWNVLGSVLSIATEKMLSSASLFLLIYCTMQLCSDWVRLRWFLLKPPQSFRPARWSSTPIAPKLSAESWKRQWPWRRGCGWHSNSTKIHQAMPTGKGESNLFAHRIIRIAQIRGGIVLC